MITLPDEEIMPFSLNASKLHLMDSLRKTSAIHSLLDAVWDGLTDVPIAALEAAGPELSRLAAASALDAQILGVTLIPPGADADLKRP